MALATGARLGPYELSSLIGAGGMGEVYKARDTRLNRDVAIKVLPASFAADPARLRRFEQEAQSIAALNHPNIVAIHDIGHDNGTWYIVSELLEGESLCEMFARGPLPHRKAISYAVQIAHALAAAHSKNIAHRDLKPDNIFITRDGRAKVLDFGLAKSITTAQREASPTDPTIAAPSPATDAGTVMGTAGYMSPEQVRGLPVDTRTDIFSFGAVLYEMLTGTRAFKRDTTAETMTAILNDDPPEVLASSRQIPPALDRIIRHCLEKSPDQRFQSARDLAFDLESSSELTPSGGQPAAKRSARSDHRRWYYAVAFLAGVLAAALAGWKLYSSHPVTGFQFHQLTNRRGDLSNARFMADGQSVLYTATWEGGTPEIYTVPADGTAGHPIGISNARLLAVSKQGEIAVALAPKEIPFTFLDPGTLARSANGNTAPKPEIENVIAADYTPDGSGLAVVRYLPDKLITQLEYPIGKVLDTAPYIDDLRFSPDGRYFAFVVHQDAGDDRGNVIVLRASGEKAATGPFFESVEGLAWTPSGDEVWYTSPLESGEIHALSVSGKSREVLSVPGRLFLRDIAANRQLLVTQGSFHSGIIAAIGPDSRPRDLSWLDFSDLRAISDDGTIILSDEQDTQQRDHQIYVRSTDGSAAVPIGAGISLGLSADKNWVVAQKSVSRADEIWLFPIGPSEPLRLSPPGFKPAITAGGFTPDSKQVIYTGAQADQPPRTWIQDVSGANRRAISAGNIIGYEVSPNGKWVLATDISKPGSNVLQPIDGGPTVPIAGLKPGDFPLSWTADNRLFVSTYPGPGDTSGHIDKLDPRTGARTSFRDISYPAVGGVTVLPPFITPDGNSYAFGYGQRLSDLYTVTGAR